MTRSNLPRPRPRRSLMRSVVAVAALATAPGCGGTDTPPPTAEPALTSTSSTTLETAPSTVATPATREPIRVDPPVTVLGPVTEAELQEVDYLLSQFFEMYLYQFTDPTEANRVVDAIGTEVMRVATHEFIKDIHASGAAFLDPSEERYFWEKIGRDIYPPAVKRQLCLTDGIQAVINGNATSDAIALRYFEILAVRTDQGWKLHSYDVWSEDHPSESDIAVARCRR